MPLIVSVQQAAANALRTWLASKFMDGTVVYPHWPEPDVKLAPRAVSVILAGARQDEILDPEVVSSVSAGGNLRTYTYRIRSCIQPLQLDIWAPYHKWRDDLLAQLDLYLNVGTAISLGTGIGSAVSSDLLLPLSDGYTGFVDFTFDAPSYSDSPESNGAKEYRAIYRGEAAVDLYVTATSPKLAQIIVQQKLHQQNPHFPATGTDVVTITASGETYTHTTP